jgi:hypothetical protein
MRRAIEALNNARSFIPLERRDIDVDGALFAVLLELLSPAERAIVEALALRGEQSTEQLQGDSTPQQVGATLSRLRRMRLVWTIRSGGVAYHDLDGWARIGAPLWRATQ